MHDDTDQSVGKPPLPRLGSSRSIPVTPSRRTRDRIAVGFTNRPNSVQSSRSSTQVSVRSSSSAQGDRLRSTAQFRGTMASREWDDREIRSKVREKILQRRVNVAPVLKEKAVNGYVSSSDLRQALRKMHVGLSEEEEAYCAGAQRGQPDDFVDVRDFMESLTVPDYEDYDPMGQSKARESRCLKQLAFPPRKTERWMQDPDTEEGVSEERGKPKSSDQTVPTSAGSNVPSESLRPTVVVNKRQARRHVKSLSDKLKQHGLSALEMFRGIDNDGSGVIEKAEFEAALKKRTDLGVLQQQIDDVWAYIDKDGNDSINYLELVGALEDDKTSSKNASTRPTSSRPGTNDTAGSRQAAVTFGDPWAQRRGRRTPALPSDHFNVRTWRGKPPRATETILVPVEESFLHCPDWLQYSAVTLNNNWLIECTGQGKIQKTREAARLERKRQSWAQVDRLVADREHRAAELDKARISGLCRTRMQWMSMLKGPWA